MNIKKKSVLLLYLRVLDADKKSIAIEQTAPEYKNIGVFKKN